MFDIMLELGIYKYFIFCLGMSVLLSVMYFALLGIINLSKEREKAIRLMLDSFYEDVRITRHNQLMRQNEITHRLNRL